MKTVTGTPKELAMYLFNLDQSKVYEIKEYKPVRGLQANKYFHKLVNELSRYNRNSGYAISDEEMKIHINTSYGTLATDDNGKIAGAIVPKNFDISSYYPYAKLYKTDESKDYYLFYKRTHELNSKEFTQLIRGLEQECRDVGIKTIDDLEFERMMREYEHEREKEKIYENTGL